MAYSAIQKRIWELLGSASDYYDMPFAPPRILVDLTGADAGQAIYDDNLLRFNMDFCRHNHRHFLRNIVAHEMAHLVAPKVYGSDIVVHGEEWQEVMTKVFSVTPANFHSYDLRQSPRYRFIYGCRCRKKETPLSAIRHNRIRRGVLYFCGDCGSRLNFLYEDTRYHTSARMKTFTVPDRRSGLLAHQKKRLLPE